MGVKQYHVVVFIYIFLLMIITCFHEPAYLPWGNVYSCPFLTLSWVLFLLLNCKNSFFIVYTRPVSDPYFAYSASYFSPLFSLCFHLLGNTLLQFLILMESSLSGFLLLLLIYFILCLGIRCQIQGPKDLLLCFLLRNVWF